MVHPTLRTKERILDSFKNNKNLNVKDYNKALLYHLENGNIECILAMNEIGVRINQIFCGGWYGLEPMIGGKNPNKVCELISHASIKQILVDNPSICVSALYRCISNNYTDIFDFLIENGFKCNSDTMYYSCLFNNDYFVNKHLAMGINGNPDELHTAQNLALIVGCEKGRCQLVNKLIFFGANVNAKNLYGRTALMSALDYPDIVNNLIAYGADINIQDNNGRSAIFYTSRDSHLNSLKILLESGADIGITDNEGNTFFHYAIAYQKIFKMVNTICSASLSSLINIKNNKGETPFTLLTNDYNCRHLINDVISIGPDLNTQDNNGNTPIMKMIMSRDHSTVKKLLRLGANVNIQNNVGRTALMLICIESVDVINLLKLFIEYGADIKITERKGRTAGYFAWSKYRNEARKLLKYNEIVEDNSYGISRLCKIVNNILTFF